MATCLRTMPGLAKMEEGWQLTGVNVFSTIRYLMPLRLMKKLPFSRNIKETPEGVGSISDDVTDQAVLLQKFTVAAATLEKVVAELQVTINTIKV